MNDFLQLKLTYFDVTGRAELTRLVLHYGGIPFVDNRLTQAQFEALKPTLPLGQAPVLEVSGETFAQSIAYARHAAKLAGLYPSEPMEALRVDMLVDTLSEVIEPIVDVCFYEKDETLQALKTKILHDRTLPKTLQALEFMVQGPYFLGKHAALADILLLDVVANRITLVPPPFGIEEHPKLAAIVETVKTSSRHRHVPDQVSRGSSRCVQILSNGDDHECRLRSLLLSIARHWAT